MPGEAVRSRVKQQRVSDQRAPVTALSDVAFVAQSLHQRIPHGGNLGDAHPWGGGLIRETESGQSWVSPDERRRSDRHRSLSDP